MAATVVGDPVVAVDGVIVHNDPVWRDRANFIIAAPIRDSDVAHTEQLWARQITGTQFEICCIPIDVYDLSLGDVVETDASYTVQRVIQPSGRFTFRAWFGEVADPARQAIAEQLTAMGALIEWSSVNLLAVDAENDQLARTVADFLADREQHGDLMYETGRS